MPRRKPDKVIENRNSLGTLERELERDRIGAEYAQAVGSGIQGIGTAIGGLGIGGGLLLGAVFFKGEFEEMWDKVKHFLPNPNYTIGSPEWIASWGDSPSEQVMQDDLEPYNDTAVDSLVSETGQTLTGQTPFQAYRIGAVGRDAEYQYRMAQAQANYTPAQLANFMNYPSSQPPPHSQSGDGYGYQLAIRETVARRILRIRAYTLGVSGIWDNGRATVRAMPGYVEDPMLDWAACATYASSHAIISNSEKERGAQLIEFFMNWQPPLP